MKKIIILALTALIMVGCEQRTTDELKNFNTVIIDSCEYLKYDRQFDFQGYGYFAHKGNCRFCKERKQKELEELVIKLKEK